jgi:hypothetical protein
MSLPDNNNALGGVFKNVQKVLKKSNMNKAAAFNRKRDWENANVFANHQTNRDALLETHKSGLMKDEHSHTVNEAIRMGKETNQAVQGAKSRAGSSTLFNKESYANKGNNNTPTPTTPYNGSNIEDANVISVTPARTQSNVQTPGISYSSPKAIGSGTPKAIGSGTPKAIGSGSTFTTGSNGETSASSGY